MSAIRYWTEQALEADRRAHTPNAQDQVGDEPEPFLGPQALALALIAMHDAYRDIPGTPALPTSPAPVAGLSPDHAAAAAAYAVLGELHAKRGRSPAAELGAAWEHYAALCHPDRPSIVYGQGVAAAVLAWDDAPPSASPSSPFEPPFGAGVGDIFADTPASQIECNDARPYGERRSGHRSPEQPLTGAFWARDGGRLPGTPPQIDMQVVLATLGQHAPGLPTDELLGILATAAVGMPDPLPFTFASDGLTHPALLDGGAIGRSPPLPHPARFHLECAA